MEESADLPSWRDGREARQRRNLAIVRGDGERKGKWVGARVKEGEGEVKFFLVGLRNIGNSRS